MSNIPHVRRVLKVARKAEEAKIKDQAIDLALKHLDREKPDFIAPKKRPPLTKAEVDYAIALRAKGLALHEIARIIGDTDIGRISEAINGKRKGI